MQINHIQLSSFTLQSPLKVNISGNRVFLWDIKNQLAIFQLKAEENIEPTVIEVNQYSIKKVLGLDSSFVCIHDELNVLTVRRSWHVQCQINEVITMHNSNDRLIVILRKTQQKQYQIVLLFLDQFGKPKLSSYDVPTQNINVKQHLNPYVLINDQYLCSRQNIIKLQINNNNLSMKKSINVAQSLSILSINQNIMIVKQQNRIDVWIKNILGQQIKERRKQNQTIQYTYQHSIQSTKKDIIQTALSLYSQILIIRTMNLLKIYGMCNNIICLLHTIVININDGLLIYCNKCYLFNTDNQILKILSFKGILSTIENNFFLTKIQEQQSHINVSKMLNYRYKMLNSLQQYLYQSNEEYDVESCLRIMHKEQNLAVLNDSLQMLIPLIICIIRKQLSNIDRINPKKCQQQLASLCLKLINSKYESHIENGLILLLQLKNDLNLAQNKIYERIVSSKRIIQMVKQQKKPKLFELTYQLIMKIKGNSFLNHLIK